jgi:hypothetical protein
LAAARGSLVEAGIDDECLPLVAGQPDEVVKPGADFMGIAPDEVL